MNAHDKNSKQHMGIDSEEQHSRKIFIDFTAQDIKILKTLRPLVERHADRIVNAFYKNIENYPELMQIIDKAGSNIDRLQHTQKQYLLELFDGQYDMDYVERRLRIGKIHNQIGLTPRWYLGSYSVYFQNILPLILGKYRFNPLKRQRAILALNKIISFDSQLSMDTYIHGLMHDLTSVSTSKESIERTVSQYCDFIEKVASGDLSNRLDVEGNDDLSKMGIFLNNMTDNLAGITSKIRAAGNAIVATVGELAASVNAQSAGASEQAVAINQTTTTLEEIKQTTTQTLEKAQALGSAAERTRQESSQGQAVVQQVITSMGSIRDKVNDIAQAILSLSEQTHQIGEITDVVTDLAQQSKMLALNASIEAAKAGEAGKGFAVVADEVKELAEQSQQSTAQVQKILQDIRHATDRAVMTTEEGTRGVDEGMSLVERTGEVMQALGGVIHDSVMASQQIVAAVRQEVTGVDQVNSAMSEINKVTQSFVASSQQTQSASEDLKQLAEQMQDSINIYKSGE
jgi:methyl-accepting chemotaxis protein